MANTATPIIGAGLLLKRFVLTYFQVSLQIYACKTWKSSTTSQREIIILSNACFRCSWNEEFKSTSPKHHSGARKRSVFLMWCLSYFSVIKWTSGRKAVFWSQFEDAVHRDGEGMVAERKATGHIASADRKQRRTQAIVQIRFSFLFPPGTSAHGMLEAGNGGWVSCLTDMASDLSPRWQ